MLGSRTVRASTRQTVFHRIRGRHTVRDLRRRQRRNDDYDEDDELSFTHRQKIFQSSLPPRHRCHNQHSVALKSCCFKEPNNVRGPPRVYTHLPNNNRGFFHLFCIFFYNLLLLSNRTLFVLYPTPWSERLCHFCTTILIPSHCYCYTVFIPRQTFNNITSFEVRFLFNVLPLSFRKKI